MKLYDPRFLGMFADLLAQREQQLCDELNQLERRRDEGAPAADVSDMKDGADNESRSQIDDARAELLAQELEQVLLAQRRVVDKSFGYCMDCGDPIALERLERLLSAAYCANCQNIREQAIEATARAAGRQHHGG